MIAGKVERSSVGVLAVFVIELGLKVFVRIPSLRVLRTVTVIEVICNFLQKGYGWLSIVTTDCIRTPTFCLISCVGFPSGFVSEVKVRFTETLIRRRQKVEEGTKGKTQLIELTICSGNKGVFVGV